MSSMTRLRRRRSRPTPIARWYMRQAMAGMLWSKQYFYYDLNVWLREHHVEPTSSPEQRQSVRNGEWFHMHNDDIHLDAG